MTRTNETKMFFEGPVIAPVLVPVEHNATPVCIDSPFFANDAVYSVTAMSFGTPHGAVFVDDVDGVDVASVGAALGAHALFPQGASIVFIQVLDRQTLKARLWQRGAGETEFTPEGACVAGTAAMMLLKTSENKVRVRMGGAVAEVEWGWGKGADVTLCTSRLKPDEPTCM